MPPSTAAIVSSAAVAGAVSYCFWFDYQRRHSPEFRKTLKKRSEAYERQEQEEAKEKRAVLESMIDDSLATQPIPETFQDRQDFFMNEVQRADTLHSSGTPTAYLESALAFYRALLAYPNPVELLSVYDKSIKTPEVMEYLRTMIVVRPPKALSDALSAAASDNSVE